MRSSQEWDITSSQGWDNFAAMRNNMVLGSQRVRVQFVGEKRSSDQNEMFYALYQQISLQKDDESIVDIRRHCKAYYGIPILLAGDPAFAAMYTKGIMHHLTVEEKLEAMDILPVSSRMSKEQGTEYIDTIIREYTKAGYSLTHPDEEYSNARG